VRIENLGTPDKIIAGFAPELFGVPLNEDDVLDTRVEQRGGVTYYFWWAGGRAAAAAVVAAQPAGLDCYRAAAAGCRAAVLAKGRHAARARPRWLVASPPAARSRPRALGHRPGAAPPAPPLPRRRQLKSHHLVAATAMRNRMFLLSVVASSRQWKKYQDKLVAIRDSFTVPEYVVPPLRD
jgi:hypothetical protein